MPRFLPLLFLPLVLGAIFLVPATAPAWEADVRASQDTTGSGQNETLIAVNPLNINNAVVVYKDYRADMHDYISATTDGGNSWHEQPIPVYDPGLTTDTDPAVFFRPDGRAYLLWTSSSDFQHGGLFTAWSDDGGLTWSAAVAVTPPAGHFDDKSWLAFDATGGPYNGNIYAAWTRFGNAEIMAARSTDGGATWSTPVQVSLGPWSRDNDGAQPLVLPDGTLIIIFLHANPAATATLTLARSTDGGITFPSNNTLFDITPAPYSLPGEQWRLVTYHSLAYDPVRRWLTLVWADYGDYNANGMDIYTSRSTDMGATWSSRFRLNDDPPGVVRDQWFPVVAAAPDGRLTAAWLDRRDDPANRLYYYYARTSTDGGLSWAPSVRVSTAPSDPGVNIPPGSDGIGDYIGLSAGPGVMWGSWVDTRNGNQDIYAARELFTPQPTPTATSTATPSGPTSTGTPTPTRILSPSVTPSCPPLWTVVDSPNVGFGDNYLLGLAAIATDNVWAVGYYTNTSGIDHSLIEHWDGARWSISAGPNVDNGNNHLQSISAIAADDIWAVGYYTTTARSNPYALTIHWDGSQWRPVSNGSDGVLNAVTTITSHDVWAVGSTNIDAPFVQTQLLTIHWNGQSWQATPNPAGDPDRNVLNAAAGTSSNDVWAAGYYSSSTQLWLQHWDGLSWNYVQIPHPCCFNNMFNGIAALTANDVWLVGNCCWDPQTAIAYHWDGTDWTVPSMPQPEWWDWLYDVAPITQDNVWAVGLENAWGMFLVHWDGLRWTRVAAPPDPRITALRGITALSANNLWAVGYSGFPKSELKQTAIVHFNGSCSTPTPTPTSCPVQFTDVPPDSTFYPYVMCLACRGIISGYPDNTFRPNNNVTRGQAAKIVSNAAAYFDPIPPDQQTFADVLPASTFWLYVERGFAHSVFQGYPCGGPGEPCDPQHRPYFRPASNLTRSQLAKLAVNAAGFTDQIPSDQQSFADVPYGNAFWLYVERAVAHSIMSGYSCGSPEPCIPPANRPYFRPGNRATRGQTAKIVSNTFFPECSP